MKQVIIKSTEYFDKKAKKLMSVDELEGLLDELEKNPESGGPDKGNWWCKKNKMV